MSINSYGWIFKCKSDLDNAYKRLLGLKYRYLLVSNILFDKNNHEYILGFIYFKQRRSCYNINDYLNGFEYFPSKKKYGCFRNLIKNDIKIEKGNAPQASYLNDDLNIDVDIKNYKMLNKILYHKKEIAHCEEVSMEESESENEEESESEEELIQIDNERNVYYIYKNNGLNTLDLIRDISVMNVEENLSFISFTDKKWHGFKSDVGLYYNLNSDISLDDFFNLINLKLHDIIIITSDYKLNELYPLLNIQQYSEINKKVITYY